MRVVFRIEVEVEVEVRKGVRKGWRRGAVTRFWFALKSLSARRVGR